LEKRSTAPTCHLKARSPQCATAVAAFRGGSRPFAPAEIVRASYWPCRPPCWPCL
jgi:hypothetical protein